MDLFRKLRLKAGYFACGQTMAEYVLIVAAVAVVAFAGYQATGSSVSTVVNNVDTKM
jgi:Flp pilus assembly pilin Flp